MKTEYAILRDGTKIPVSDLYLDTETPGMDYPLRCYSNPSKFWTILGQYEIENAEDSHDILNIDDVLETLNHFNEDPLAQYRTPQAMADTHAAYARGEKIESVYNGIGDIKYFIPDDKPRFNWFDYTYRPAPKWEPKVGEIVLAMTFFDDFYRIAFYGGVDRLSYKIFLDQELKNCYPATDIKPFTQDK